MKTHRILISALLWTLLPLIAAAQAKTSDFLRSNPKFLQAFREPVAAPSKSTVRVKNDGKDVALGVVIADDGWILTKAFDLKGKVTCRLRDDKELEARIIGVHAVHDLAVLEIEAKDLAAVTFKPSKSVPVGSWVASVGLAADPVAVGVVSVPTRDVAFKGGAPIAASELSKIGFLGVRLEPTGGKGLRVTFVLADSPAAAAGLLNDDVLLKVSGAAVNDPEDFQAEMIKRRPGDRITLVIERDRAAFEVEATLQARPKGDGRAELQNNMGSELSARRSGYPTILTHDSVVRPTDCGGPLVDLDGNVLGINISRAGRTESWTVPTEVIQRVLADLKAGKSSPLVAAPQPARPQ
jgi:serine protease Do